MITVPRRPRKGWLRRVWARHPRVAMALRAALAAAIAWVVARNLPDPAGDYPYYAPMGAVIATSTTLAGSVREGLQSVAAIALGGLVATAADQVGEESHPLVLAGAVAVAVVVGGWRRLGGMGAWVPTAALFTLIIGGGEAYYVGVYAGMVFLGAAIGLVLTFLMPQLPLAPVQEAQTHLRDMLVSKLQNLADLLDDDEGLDVDEWNRRYQDPGPYIAAMRGAMSEAEQATRGNRRARRYREAYQSLRQQGQALERAANAVDEASRLAKENERPGVEVYALGPELRPSTAQAARALADVFDSVSWAKADPDALRGAHECIDELTRRADEVRRSDRPGGGMLAASSIIMALSRSLDLLEEGHRSEEAEERAAEEGAAEEGAAEERAAEERADEAPAGPTAETPSADGRAPEPGTGEEPTREDAVPETTGTERDDTQSHHPAQRHTGHQEGRAEPTGAGDGR